MKTILISFEPEWFYYLESGTKKFEYRKHFPNESIEAYFYVSRPVKAITGFARFGEREKLQLWPEKYQDRPKEVLDRISDFMTDCEWAVPVIEFQKTNSIPLDRIRADLPGFVVPRMYYFIDGSPLLEYLKNNLFPEGPAIRNTFETILDSDIC